LLGYFNAKVGREDIFKPTIGNESLHEISNDNGVRVVNFATSKNLSVKSTMFPHRNIHKVTWTSPDGRTHNQIGHILIDRRRHSSILGVREFRAANCDTHHYLEGAKLRERSLQRLKKQHIKFTWSEVEGKERYRVEISNRFAALENVDTEGMLIKLGELYLFLWLDSPILGLGRLRKISVSFRLLDQGQSGGLLGRVISSSEGLC
jgi:hypothetical protein